MRSRCFNLDDVDEAVRVLIKPQEALYVLCTAIIASEGTVLMVGTD
jgi:hypothetical protein